MANFPLLYDLIQSIDWTGLKQVDTVDDACDLFYSSLNRVIQLCVPTYRKRKFSYPPWFTSEIINNIRRKYQERRAYDQFKTMPNLVNFRELRATIKKQIKESYAAYVVEVQRNVISDPSKFWAHLNARKRKSRLPDSIKHNGQILDNPLSIVNGFSDFFASVYRHSDNSLLQHFETSIHRPTITMHTIVEDDIIQAAKKLKNKMTSGVDNIPSLSERLYT
ncbi:hypothetical protein PPYR_08115 [Photinus pyralis]|uniref:Reverse transcriptase domain-containing protein n=1 Tax=Photinus pyralis TaxID=7054 RepID=A0A1Y1MYQ1_PHOPY|nr:hypothetical protein PPYR_08115 [Photinus pyralis]